VQRHIIGLNVAESDPDSEMAEIQRRLDASDELIRIIVREAGVTAKKHRVSLTEPLRDAGMRLHTVGFEELRRKHNQKGDAE
jgi:hypothetical protein